MKKTFIFSALVFAFLIGLILISRGLFAATANPTWTQQYIYSTFIGTNPGYGTPAGQTATSAPFQSIWFGHFTSNDVPPLTGEVQVGNASVDILDSAHAGLSYTYNGVTATNAQIYGLLNASMTAAYNAQLTAAKAAGKPTGIGSP